MNTTTLTIGTLSVKVQAAGLGGATFDTAVATEFDVEVDFVTGDLGAVEVRAVKASANVHFEGTYSDVLVRRGAELIELFTGREVDALAERCGSGQ